MTEVQTPPADAPAPAWMLALEKKRQRVHRLAHEIGAGSRCLLCNDDCPGLDLHFWRKICRNCRCKKEDHDVIDDCGLEQFEILLGSGHSNSRPNKAFLEMLEKHTSAGLKSKLKSLAFDWVPPDVSPVVAAEYMQALPASKLPISGSDGALYRRQQLERQLPLHDLDANQCHQLSDAEVDNLKKYLENLKNNVVGQGRVMKLTLPTSSSLDSLQKVCTYNSVPKPFQPSTGGSTSYDTHPEFNVGGLVESSQPVHLKPPSAYWPKSLSPEPARSLSPAPDGLLPSVADRGAAFGVKLSPASLGRRVASKNPEDETQGQRELLLSDGRGIQQPHMTGQLVKDRAPTSLTQSSNVPGNMWVPAECVECSRKSIDGLLVKGHICTHIAMSSDVAQKIEPSSCTECTQKIVDGQLVGTKICTHTAASSINPNARPAEYCAECIQKVVDGKLVTGQICSHISNSSDNPIHTLPAHSSVYIPKSTDGKLVNDQIHIPSFNSSNNPTIPSVADASEFYPRAVDVRFDRSQPHRDTISSVPLAAECQECLLEALNGLMGHHHICSQSSDAPNAAPVDCEQCLKKSLDGLQGHHQSCPHTVHSRVPQPKVCDNCVKKGVDGKLVKADVCTHLASACEVPQILPSESASLQNVKRPGYSSYGTTTSIPPDLSALEKSPVRGPSPLPPPNWNHDPSEMAPNEPRDNPSAPPLSELRVPSAYPDTLEHGAISREKSPTSMMSSSSAPHMMALYAHNALHSPSGLDPQDKLSPHVASLSIDDKPQSEGSLISQDPVAPTDPTPLAHLNLNCAECRESILPGEIAVFADRAGSDIAWHPTCFVCNTCQELLVDLVYFYNKGHVYCGRHYAEILDIPRCSACDELIFVNEYTVAEGQAFHVKHFCCFECDEPLGGKQYVPKEGQPVCLPCYERKYGKQCQSCQLVIGAKDQGVSWKDLHWHAAAECFCCYHCQKSLLGGRFAVRDERPFCCKECMQASLSTNHQKVSAV
ncbi:Prickle-like protein 2 [Frankliniella fusca]|uniref:Prickle-like protein 2 n=1 Tax=Frankliniella fusca TaxID=407009 RepID=A0AAE1HUL9_9NEOP|nr:Prickle-like protein 2 [Frankliniella fusca]